MSKTYRVQTPCFPPSQAQSRFQPWEGHAPGWEIDMETGYTYFFPPDEPDQRNANRRRYELMQIEIDDLIDEMIESGMLPAIYPYEIAGKQPSKESLAVVRNALRKLPTVFLRAIIDAKQRIDVVAGRDAAIHPKAARGMKNCLGLAGRSFAVVAADDDGLEHTTLHEAAHLLDHNKKISASSEWLQIWRDDVRRGTVFRHNAQCEDPAEYFGCQFANYWRFPESREEMSLAVQKFMQNLPNWFA